MLGQDDLQREAAATGFSQEPLEKVILLINLLQDLRSHPFLKPRIALKGGTAINLFAFDVPRLSVDVDVNYIGAADRETMLGERPKVEQAVQAVCGRLGLRIRRVPTEHAGGKWRLSFLSVMGRESALELDVNFMLRVPLWPVALRDSRAVGSYQATAVPVLDDHELAGAKLSALLSRRAGRDLFDAHHFLTRAGLDHERLRLAFVVYGGINRRDWRTVKVEDVAFETREIRQRLIPLLREEAVKRLGLLTDWAERLVEESRSGLKAVLPFDANEREFLDRLLDHGEIQPALITQDPELGERIRRHPGLEWKALNVRRFKGKQ